MLLRNALVPYIYTAARFAYDTGVSIIRPLYYYFDGEEAYTFKQQYLFGSSRILVAPIASKIDNKTQQIEKHVWFPKTPHNETWLTFAGNGPAHIPGTVLQEQYSLQDIPVFVQQGTVIPMRTMA